MIMNELLTYDQVMQKANKPHLLLGNGFSMSYDRERFSFTSLLESAVKNSIIDNESHVYRLFKKLSTADFESVMKILDQSGQVLDVYDGDQNTQIELRKDAELLKEYLVKIITNNHPEKSTDLTTKEKQSCLNFLERFPGKIYTLNYDLLLYWATMEQKGTRFTDGFSNTEESEVEPYVVFQNSGSFNMHYLHGGLHIYDAGHEIIKKTYTNSNINLIEQTRSSLNKREYPIFISEGESNQKLAKIIHNAYLNHCYKSLKKIGNDLVIFGTGLKKNDQHILDAILDSAVTDIYFGVSNVESASQVEEALSIWNSEAEDWNRKNKRKQKKMKTLHCYDYRTVDIWGKNGL